MGIAHGRNWILIAALALQLGQGGGIGQGGGTPSNAPFWLAAANAATPNAKNLGALSTALVVNTAGTPSAYAGSTCSAGSRVFSISATGVVTCTTTAPSDAQYWTGAANGELSAEKNLGALGTGLVLNTAGVPTAYAGSGCSTGSYVESISATGVATCVSLAPTVALLDADIQKRMLRPIYGGTAWLSIVGANNIPVATGFPASNALTQSGTMADASDATYPFVSFSNAAVGRLGLIINGSIPAFQTQHDPRFQVVMKTGADITDARYFFGLGSGTDITASSDDPALSYVGIRYSTSASDPGWVGVCNNNVTQRISTKVADIAANTTYLIEITMSADGTLASFRVNLSTVQTLSLNLPAGNTALFPQWNMRNLAVEAKSWSLARASVEWGMGNP